jgi:hypothetical protein
VGPWDRRTDVETLKLRTDTYVLYCTVCHELNKLTNSNSLTFRNSITISKKHANEQETRSGVSSSGVCSSAIDIGPWSGSHMDPFQGLWTCGSHVALCQYSTIVPVTSRGEDMVFNLY